MVNVNEELGVKMECGWRPWGGSVHITSVDFIFTDFCDIDLWCTCRWNIDNREDMEDFSKSS